jgi:hypothetical protein
MPLQITLVINDSERRAGWDQVALNQVPLSQAGSFSSSATFTIGTTEETLSFGDITPGRIAFFNLDGTNFVEWGFATGARPGRLRPKVAATDPCGAPNTIDVTSGTTIYIKADTASCEVKAVFYRL